MRRKKEEADREKQVHDQVPVGDGGGGAKAPAAGGGCVEAVAPYNLTAAEALAGGTAGHDDPSSAAQHEAVGDCDDGGGSRRNSTAGTSKEEIKRKILAQADEVRRSFSRRDDGQGGGGKKTSAPVVATRHQAFQPYAAFRSSSMPAVSSGATPGAISTGFRMSIDAAVDSLAAAAAARTSASASASARSSIDVSASSASASSLPARPTFARSASAMSILESRASLPGPAGQLFGSQIPLAADAEKDDAGMMKRRRRSIDSLHDTSPTPTQHVVERQPYTSLYALSPLFSKEGGLQLPGGVGKGASLMPPAPMIFPGIFQNHDVLAGTTGARRGSSPLGQAHSPPSSSDAVGAFLDRVNQSSQSVRLNCPPYEEILVNNNDVICGRGVVTDSLVGNRRFRVLLDLRQREYAAATSEVERLGIARSIVDAIAGASPSGRFIRMDVPSGVWSVADEDVSANIVQRALVERAAVVHKPTQTARTA